jgi:hypothetical protein
MDVGVPSSSSFSRFCCCSSARRNSPTSPAGWVKSAKEFRKGLHDSSDTAEDKPPEAQAGG